MTVKLHKSGRIEINNDSFLPGAIQTIRIREREGYYGLFVNDEFKAVSVGDITWFPNGIWYGTEAEARADYDELCRILDAYHAGKAAPVVEKESL